MDREDEKVKREDKMMAEKILGFLDVRLAERKFERDLRRSKCAVLEKKSGSSESEVLCMPGRGWTFEDVWDFLDALRGSRLVCWLDLLALRQAGKSGVKSRLECGKIWERCWGTEVENVFFGAESLEEMCMRADLAGQTDEREGEEKLP